MLFLPLFINFPLRLLWLDLLLLLIRLIGKVEGGNDVMEGRYFLFYNINYLLLLHWGFDFVLNLRLRLIYRLINSFGLCFGLWESDIFICDLGIFRLLVEINILGLIIRFRGDLIIK